ncbi:MAG: dihydroorotase [Nitrospinota bacterium]|nr:MAG: dihydroorotase [Nitrospinota bacterium]
MKLLIRGGRVLDPARDIDDQLDVLVEGGKIIGLERNLTLSLDERKTTQVIEATGKLVVPGLIDIHTHLREPGFEHKETLQTGMAAAAAGGFTSIACMANTSPPNDNQAVTLYIRQRAREIGTVNVFPIGAVSVGLKGERLAEIGELKEAGVIAVSDDGLPVATSQLMRRALEYTKMFDLPVIDHCEDLSLIANGAMHESLVSTELGLRGIPRESEDIIVARDILLTKLTRGRFHVAHVSSKGAVELIRWAKDMGLQVTAEVTPHHLLLTDEAVRSFDTNTKMNPPLRSAADREALQQALKDGTIDAIATDHAPHNVAEKEFDYDHAPFGVSGLETALPLVLELVRRGLLSLQEAIAKLTYMPAKIMRLDKGSLAPGKDADITIIDLEHEYTIDVHRFRSMGKNSPFHGWKVKGAVVFTIVGGRIVYRGEMSD